MFKLYSRLYIHIPIMFKLYLNVNSGFFFNFMKFKYDMLLKKKKISFFLIIL